MRVLLLARKPIGELVYRAIADDVAGLVTNREPEGWWASSFADAATCPLYDDVTPELAAQFDAILSVQHPKRISRDVLDAVRWSAWNLHLAPLPEYGGYNGPTLAILHGDAEYGATLHWLDEGLDTGDIAYEARFPIEPTDTAQSLYRKAEDAGLGLVRKLAADWTPEAHQQDRGKARYYGHGLEDGLRHIWDMADVSRKARAFYFPPFPPAYIEEDGRRYAVTPWFP